MTASITLEGKVAIVTGGSRGIGEAIARTFVAHGARVAVVSRKIEELGPVAESIGPSAVAIAANTGREDECERLVRTAVEKLGRVDILVNNAAMAAHFGPMIDVDARAWDRTFDVNAKGYFWMTREVARHLRSREAPGSIINVASVAGLTAAPFQGVYAMTKAAVLSMTKTMAYELAANGIRVNAIAPGYIETKFAAPVLQNDVFADEIVKRTPMKRFGQPDEIAGAALYLASDAASYMTGQAMVIDGGMLLG